MDHWLTSSNGGVVEASEFICNNGRFYSEVKRATIVASMEKRKVSICSRVRKIERCRENESD